MKPSIFSLLAGKSFLLLLLMSYGVQHLLHIFYYSFFITEYRAVESLSFAPLSLALVLLGLMILFDRYLPSIRLKKLVIQRNLFWVIAVVVYIIPLTYVGIWFYKNATIEFRYVARLSDFGSVAYVLGMQQYIFKFHIFITIISFINNKTMSRFQRSLLIYCAFFFGLTITGTLDLMFVIMALLFGLFPELFKKILKSNNLSYFKTFVVIFLICIVIFSMVFFGFANKEGYVSAFTRFSTTSYQILGIVFARVSSGYATVVSLDTQLDFWNINAGGVIGSWDTLLYRFNILFGIDQEFRDVTRSVGRLNYETVYNDYLPRAGASPGPLGSLYYFPFMPLSFLFHALFYLLILRLIQSFIDSDVGQLNIFTTGILCLTLLPFFKNPYEYMEIIGPPTVYMICLLLASVIKVRQLNFYNRSA